MEPLTSLSDTELLDALGGIVSSTRHLLGRLLRVLGEVEERRLHLAQGYSSMFDFCTAGLRMSEGEAFRRIAAARLGRRFPLMLERIERGEVHLTAVVLLRDHLIEEDCTELLDAARGQSKRDIEKLLAARFPKPDVPDVIRKLPRRRAPGAGRHARGGDEWGRSEPEVGDASSAAATEDGGKESEFDAGAAGDGRNEPGFGEAGLPRTEGPPKTEGLPRTEPGSGLPDRGALSPAQVSEGTRDNEDADGGRGGGPARTSRAFDKDVVLHNEYQASDLARHIRGSINSWRASCGAPPNSGSQQTPSSHLPGRRS